MQEQKWIICFSNEDWDEYWRRRQHLMWHLSKYYKILFIEPPLSFPNGLNGPFKRRDCELDYRRKIVGALRLKFLRKINSSIFTWYFMLPFHCWVTAKISFLRPINHFISKHILLRMFKKFKIDNPIVWVSQPYWLEWISFDLLNKLGRVMYDMADDYLLYPGLSKKSLEMIARNERVLLEKASRTFAVSEEIKSRKEKLSRNISVIPNGVDADKFRNCNGGKLKGYTTPIIGYMGNIAPGLIDIPLVERLARFNANWSIVMIGSVNMDVSALKEFKNIFFLGKVPYDDLPLYANDFSVAIMPFSRVGYFKTFDPLKMYEYMAMGKPVVTVDFPRAYDFKDVLYLAKTPEEFVLQVNEALKNGVNKKLLEKIIQENTWEVRASDIMKVLSK